MTVYQNKTLRADQIIDLLSILKNRFEKYPERHRGVEWNKIQSKLEASPQKLWSLSEMERTGGQPDVVHYDSLSEEYIFFDCSPESPVGRRSLCYDRAGLESRKEFRPENTAMELAAELGIDIVSEEQYRTLQRFGPFDAKTSSWILTPPDIRKAGGALFADFRYGHVFVYHNGAQSYYNSRGFRGILKI